VKRENILFVENLIVIINERKITEKSEIELL
jgi:hypothetical protein